MELLDGSERGIVFIAVIDEAGEFNALIKLRIEAIKKSDKSLFFMKY